MTTTYAPPIVILPDPPAGPTRMGLIAGGGRLPVLVAEGMRAAGHSVHCVGFAGQCDDELRGLCDDYREVGALRPGSWGRSLRRFGVRYAVMVGRVDKARLMHDWSAIIRSVPEIRALWMFFRLRADRRSHLILAALADSLARDGVLLIDSTTHITEHIAGVGAMTRHQPSSAQRADIEFAWPLLQELLRLDIGQSMAVRERDVLAVEAVEGTDRMIERTGALCRQKGWTLLKGARAGHDRRSDVPTVGEQTVRNLHAAGGRCLALASGDVIIVDKAKTVALADQLGVAVVGVPPV